MEDIQIVDPRIERYLAALHARRSEPALEAMEALARERRFPIVGRDVGRLLAAVARARGARSVFELGSGFGYSAYWFAQALPDGGELHLTDGKAEDLALARRFLAQAGLDRRVKFHYHAGDALASLAAASGSFDVFFCDIDKWEYPAAFDAVYPRMRPGDLLIHDNVLWSGQVTDPEPDDEWTRGVVAFTERIYGREDLMSSIVPIRDGVSITVKR